MKRPHCLHGLLEAARGDGRKHLGEPEFLRRNRQEPCFRSVAEGIPSQGEKGARIGGVGHDLRSLVRLQLAPLHLVRRVHGGVHKDDFIHAGNRVRQFGGEQGADQRAHARQAQVADGLGHARPHAIVTAQGVAVADDENFRFNGNVAIHKILALVSKKHKRGFGRSAVCPKPQRVAKPIRVNIIRCGLIRPCAASWDNSRSGICRRGNDQTTFPRRRFLSNPTWDKKIQFILVLDFTFRGRA